MSYPDTRYRGDKGEISAKFRPADQAPELTIGSSTAARYLATGATTQRTIRLVQVGYGTSIIGAERTLPQDDVRNYSSSNRTLLMSRRSK